MVARTTIISEVQCNVYVIYSHLRLGVKVTESNLFYLDLTLKSIEH